MRLQPYVVLIRLFALSEISVSAQFVPPKAVPRQPYQRIPDKPFTSWSLFSGGDSAWLVSAQEAALRELQVRYKALGETTGPNHTAVWFERFESAKTQRQMPGSIDVDRNVKYCSKFKLTPSEGPHIVMTTVHPDKWKVGDSKIVLSFAGRSIADIQYQLSKLNDQIASGQLSQEELDSVAWWNAWTSIIESACKWLGKFQWSIDAKLFKIERSGICG